MKTTTVRVEESAAKAIRIAYTRKHGSNRGITKLVSEALRRLALDLEAK